MMDQRRPDLSEAEQIEAKRHDCGNCGGIGCVEKDMENVYTNEAIGLKIVIPAHICARCEAVVYEPDDYRNLLQAEENAEGRPYVKVEIKNGRISKYSLH